MQVFEVDEAVAGLAEGFRGAALAEAVHGQAAGADAGGKRGEVAVAGDEAEAVKGAAVEQIHRINDEAHVGRVLAFGVGELLYRDERVFEQHVFFPALRFGAAPVAVDAFDAGDAVFGDFGKEAADGAGGGVVGVDEDGELMGV